MITTLDPLQIRKRLGRAVWSEPRHWGPAGWYYENRDEHGTVIVSIYYEEQDGHEWIHASLAFAHRLPDYGELCILHRAVFDHGHAYQCFVPPSEHVNMHENALHLWGRADGQSALPDFGRYGSI